MREEEETLQDKKDVDSNGIFIETDLKKWRKLNPCVQQVAVFPKNYVPMDDGTSEGRIDFPIQKDVLKEKPAHDGTDISEGHLRSPPVDSSRKNSVDANEIDAWNTISRRLSGVTSSFSIQSRCPMKEEQIANDSEDSTSTGKYLAKDIVVAALENISESIDEISRQDPKGVQVTTICDALVNHVKCSSIRSSRISSLKHSRKGSKISSGAASSGGTSKSQRNSKSRSSIEKYISKHDDIAERVNTIRHVVS